ncbi:biotin/lipoyl-containing protein, partial [Avibacterium paragallinarum]
MAKEIQIPDIGGDEVTVTEVMVKAGDTVEVDQSVINVEGDKASMEVPSPEAGVIKEVLVKVGDKVSTGTPMFILESADSAPASAPAVEEKAAPASTAPTQSAVSSVIEIHVPDIGGDEVNVTEILVNVGDSVAEEQSILNVEGDKASMEVPAPVAGVVKEILIKVGDKVSTGSLVMKFETTSASAPAAQPVAEAPAAPAAVSGGVQDVHVPDIGGDEVNVTEIMVAVGDSVSEEQSLITVEGDKASMEVPAPFAGVVKEILVKSGDKVSTGSLIMRFEVAGSAPVATPAAQPTTTAPVQPQATAPAAPAQSAQPANQAEVTASASFAHATPVVRRLAREFG